MEAISAKYDLDLMELNKVKTHFTDMIHRHELNIDTLQKLDIQIYNRYQITTNGYLNGKLSKYKELSLELKVQSSNDFFKVVKDSYESRFSKEYTLICNNFIKNYDTIDEIKKYYDICIELGNKPELYKNGKEIEELTPIKTMDFNRLTLYNFQLDESYFRHEYKNTKFSSYGYSIIHTKNFDPWILYASQNNLQYLIKNDFPTNTKGIVYHYKDNDDKLAMETISKSLSGFPPIIMVDVLTEDIKNEILEFLL